MTALNMAAITASLERSLQSFSLNNHSTTTTSSSSGEGLGVARSSISSESPDMGFQHSPNSSDATLELNSNITLPYHWEQCLDLKTGEVYYINWRTGMKSKEDPRAVDDGFSGSEEDDEDEEEISYDSTEGSSVESSAPTASSSRKQIKENEKENNRKGGGGGGDNVLVVAGCKGCFMYLMVPKQVEDCPRCCGQLLHFDRSHDNIVS